MTINAKTIIWDWNGTLLNDMEICIDSMNILLENRQLPFLDIGRYRQIFTFPVKEYYKEAGFDFTVEPFDIPAMQFIANYRLKLPAATLQPKAKAILSKFNEMGMQQFVLSVMEQELLDESITRLGIKAFFKRISGIDNHYGNGKLELARHVLGSMGKPKEEILLIGDTLHDHEVAEATGINCILIAHGHQSAERLKDSGRDVVNNFDELLTLF